jgi:hypothetical protein
MSSTTTNSTRQHHSVLSRVHGWRPLAKASAAAGAAAAVTAGVTLSMLTGGAASAATKPAWFMTAGDIQSLSQTDSATAACAAAADPPPMTTQLTSAEAPATWCT